MTPEIAALLRKRAALEESGADKAVLNEFDWAIEQSGYRAEDEKPLVEERKAPEKVTAEQAKPVAKAAPAEVKRGPGRPKKSAG